ncbi:hypothetical protein YC2023_016799 [Brassica napus]|uniref:Exportin-T n=1 Tax=Brassica napus TaxID=3708 RepID=A0A816K2K7_BRANA|nr:unnamed protein product [Brassica napus]
MGGTSFIDKCSSFHTKGYGWVLAFLVLLNQLLCKFSTSVRDILEEVYHVVAGRIYIVIPRDGFPSRSRAVSEETRKLIKLQRTLYTFLHVMATHDFSSVFLTPKSIVHLETMMHLLLNTSCTHKDITVRKVPDFQKFMIDTFAKKLLFVQWTG